MSLKELLDQKGITLRQCSQMSGVPYTTLLELAKGKTNVGKCSADTIYKLAKTLDTTMEEIMLWGEYEGKQVSFETFKGNMCHRLKEKGDVPFLIEILEKDEVQEHWKRRQYLEAYYTLAMVDYLSRENDLPLCNEYEQIRNTSLKEPVFPRDISLMAKLDASLDFREEAIQEAIPEFRRFNLIEKEVRDVV